MTQLKKIGFSIQSTLNQEAAIAKPHHEPLLIFGLQRDVGYNCQQSEFGQNPCTKMSITTTQTLQQI